jgi:hypothetical protein
MRKSKMQLKPRARKLLQRYSAVGDIPAICPDFFYRHSVLPLYMGMEFSQINKLIEEGKLPALVSLTDNGRAKGLFGSQILEWKQKRIAAAAKKVA